MQDYERRTINPALVLGTGLILGILFGLIVLGWWLWPVQWVDAGLEDLRFEHQVEYLSASIGAYGYTGNGADALRRYEALGEGAETVLAQIVQNPGGLEPDLVEVFSRKIAGVEAADLAAAALPEPKGGRGISTGLAALIAGVLVLAGAGLIYVFLRGRTQGAEVAAAPTELAGRGELLAPEEEATGGELPTLEEIEVSGNLVPLEVEAEAEVIAAGAPLEPYVPGEKPPVEIEEIVEETLPSARAEIFAKRLFESPEAEAGMESPNLPPFLAAAGLAASADQEGELAIESEIPEDVDAVIEEKSDLFEDVLRESEAAEGMAVESPISRSEAVVLEGETVEEIAADERSDLFEDVLRESEAVEEMTAGELFEETPDFDLEEEVAEAQPDDESAEPIEVEEAQAAAPVQPPAPAPPPDEPVVNKGVREYDPLDVKMRKKLEHIESIGPDNAGLLASAGILTTGKLLVEGVTREGRLGIAEKTGLSGAMILKWINQIDLYRIKGIGAEFTELLETAGVDTVAGLAQRDAENLHQTLLAVNEQEQVTSQTPTLEQVADWVEQAKTLPRIIQY